MKSFNLILTKEQKNELESIVDTLICMDNHTNEISSIDIAKYCVKEDGTLFNCRTDLVIKFKNDIPSIIGDWMTEHNSADNLTTYVGADFIGEDEAAGFSIWHANTNTGEVQSV